MHVELPYNCFPGLGVSRREAASKRKVVLPHLTKQVLELQGYHVGGSLKVPGGYAYSAINPQGDQIKIGLKTATDRWLNTARTLVEKVDLVFVTTVGYNDKGEPASIEIYEFDASYLLGHISKVEDEALRQGKDCHVYMPLDESEAELKSYEIGAVAGALIPHSKCIFEARILWSNAEWASLKPDSEEETETKADSTERTVREIIIETKERLAELMKVSPSNINLKVEFTA